MLLLVEPGLLTSISHLTSFTAMALLGRAITVFYGKRSSPSPAKILETYDKKTLFTWSHSDLVSEIMMLPPDRFFYFVLTIFGFPLVCAKAWLMSGPLDVRCQRQNSLTYYGDGHVECFDSL